MTVLFDFHRHLVEMDRQACTYDRPVWLSETLGGGGHAALHASQPLGPPPASADLLHGPQVAGAPGQAWSVDSAVIIFDHLIMVLCLNSAILCSQSRFSALMSHVVWINWCPDRLEVMVPLHWEAGCQVLLHWQAGSHWCICPERLGVRYYCTDRLGVTGTSALRCWVSGATALTGLGSLVLLHWQAGGHWYMCTERLVSDTTALTVRRSLVHLHWEAGCQVLLHWQTGGHWYLCTERLDVRYYCADSLEDTGTSALRDLVLGTIALTGLVSLVLLHWQAGGQARSGLQHLTSWRSVQVSSTTLTGWGSSHVGPSALTGWGSNQVSTTVLTGWRSVQISTTALTGWGSSHVSPSTLTGWRSVQVSTTALTVLLHWQAGDTPCQSKCNDRLGVKQGQYYYVNRLEISAGQYYCTNGTTALTGWRSNELTRWRSSQVGTTTLTNWRSSQVSRQVEILAHFLGFKANSCFLLGSLF